MHLPTNPRFLEEYKDIVLRCRGTVYKDKFFNNPATAQVDSFGDAEESPIVA